MSEAITETTPAPVTPETTATPVKPDGEPPATSTPADEPKSVATDEYALKLPEETLLDQSNLEEISAFAKTHKLTPEQAQALLEREHGGLNLFGQTQAEMHQKQMSEWAKHAEADAEYGGEKFKENVELAHRAVKKFGSDGFVKMLEETGYGNHPEVLRTFVRIGKLAAEDKAILSNPTTPSPRSLEEIFYGKKEGT